MSGATNDRREMLTEDERATMAALRTEIGPPTERDGKWQPMVSAAELRLLLNALDRLAAQEGERGCPTPGCPGDVRYAAPGRNHIAGCTYPSNLATTELADFDVDGHLHACPRDGECGCAGSLYVVAQEGERGGADIQLGHRWRAVGPNAAELWNECSYCRAKEGLPAATRPCPLAPKGERGEAEVAAAVEAVLPVGPRPFADAYFIGAHDLAARIRAALADPAGALAKVKAEVLRAAADEARVVFVSPTFSLWLRERAERIEAQP